MTTGKSLAAAPPRAAASLHDPEGFGEVFDTYFREIHGYAAKRLGRDAAYDVASQTFLEAFNKRHRYDEARAGVRTWLYGIATNLIGKHQRSEVRGLRARARLGTAADRAEGHAERVDDQVSAEGLRGALADAIARLSQGDRDVLLLVALAELSHEEVAAALDIPYGTVGSRLSRARKKVREALGGTNPMLDLEDDHG
ncbi:RNA polymerase sigma factor [Actinomadura rudentiformis]|uniref:Sigma-70 family RNA polymerase sigma factor n=1 Tax=Actinomadura rudentiformis TaxID=359158 RepID=A0A6H9YSQ5_9ACTN|nr:sigma-70 family RNA polymerase sigma factor [Actinomadura rudentiformis]KAB2348493.1 sigma-70 family RNA polymerase sigma factor [Actinomadura rudentiformis]